MHDLERAVYSHSRNDRWTMSPAVQLLMHGPKQAVYQPSNTHRWLDFLNGVTTHTIWLTHGKLTYYTGNYDTFVKTVKENEVIQQKKYEKEQEDRKHIKVRPARPALFPALLQCPI
eukprot:1137564-Pelagomonas_calceolata.AAC.2